MENLTVNVEGETVLNNLSFIVAKGDKIAFIGQNNQAKTLLFQTLMGELAPDEGEFKCPSATKGSCENKTFSGVPSFDKCPRTTPLCRISPIASCAACKRSCKAATASGSTRPSPYKSV